MKKTIVMMSAWLLSGMALQSATAASGDSAAGISATVKTSMPAITRAWARATAPGQPVGAVYMTIASPVGATLQRIETSAARSVEIHTMHHENGVMRMRAVEPLRVTAGVPIELAPGGMHVMLMGLKQPLKAGETVRLKLTFAIDNHAAATLVVDAPIQTTEPQ